MTRSGGHLPMLTPLSTATRAEAVVERLREAVTIGLLADGERLPVEFDLADQLGVSPMTLREALRTLREEGLLETRRGRSGGTFVRRTSEPDPAKDRAEFANSTLTDLRDLTDEQQAVEGTAARLAAERSTIVHTRRLFALTDQVAAADNRGAQIRADSRFHIEVGVASTSQRLTRHTVRLQAATAPKLWLPDAPLLDVEAVAQDHLDIARAIAEEDGAAAQHAAVRHVTRNLRRLSTLLLELSQPKESQERDASA